MVMKNKLPLLFLQVLLPCFMFAQNYSFSRVADCPESLYSPASINIGDSIFVVGGVIGHGCCAPKNLTQHVWLYNTDADTWTRMSDFPGLAVYGASSFVIDGKGYLCNGWDSTETGNGPNKLWQYDPSTDSWTTRAPFPGPTRYTSCCFAINHKGYIGLGFKPYTNDFWEYDPATNAWTQKASFPGPARQAPVNFAIGNYGYVGLGALGNGMGGFYYQSDFYKYDPSNDSWTALSVFPGDPIASTFAFYLNGEEYVADGSWQNSYNYSFQGESNKVWKYDAPADTWTLWGLFPDSALAEGAMGSGNGAGFMGLGATNSLTTFAQTKKFYRFGPGTAPFSCTSTIAEVFVNNATRYFQVQGNFSPNASITWTFGDNTTGSGSSVYHTYADTGTYVVMAVISDTASNCNNTETAIATIYNISNCSVTLGYTNINSIYTLVANTQGVGPYIYTWSNINGTTFSQSPDPLVNINAGDSVTFCLTISDSTGCQAHACETIVGAPDTTVACQTYLYIFPDPTIPGLYYGQVYHTGSSPAVLYSWNFGDGTIVSLAGDSMPSHQYPANGFYTICLSITDSDGCVSSYCDSFFYAYKVGGGPMNHFEVVPRYATGVGKVSANLNLSVYPNPATDELRIATAERIDHLTIYSAIGQKVQDIQSPTNNVVTISNLSSGIYFIDVRIGSSTGRIKFIKTN